MQIGTTWNKIWNGIYKRANGVTFKNHYQCMLVFNGLQRWLRGFDCRNPAVVFDLDIKLIVDSILVMNSHLRHQKQLICCSIITCVRTCFQLIIGLDWQNWIWKVKASVECQTKDSQIEVIGVESCKIWVVSMEQILHFTTINHFTPSHVDYTDQSLLISDCGKM
jgi:hypothetical protein